MTWTLADLEALIARRASELKGDSYTASLLREHPERTAKKLGEEAVELVIAAQGKDRTRIVSEAADVLYHLLVLLKGAGVSLAEVEAELARRTAQSGLAEKAARLSPE